MKGIIDRIASALAVKFTGLADLRKEEQRIYRDALRKKLAGRAPETKKEQQVSALDWQHALAPVAN